MTESVLIWGCIYLYTAASILLLTGFVFGKERVVRWTGWLVLPAFLAHTTLVLWRWARTGYFPANGELENALTGSWLAIAFTVYLFVRNRTMSGIALFTVPTTLLLLGYGIMRAPTPLPLAASLKSSWLIIHVLFAQLAFGAYVIASAFGLLYLLKEHHERRGPPGAFYRKVPRLPVMDENMFRFVIYGFIAETVMLAAGAIWAKELWGNYWAWDPVEVWALISWLLYGLTIHLRVTLGWRGRRMAWLMIALLSTVVISYWGVDIVVKGSRHVFGVTS
jgi:cytochrome c-type biogenesis protein CcsB